MITGTGTSVGGRNTLTRRMVPSRTRTGRFHSASTPSGTGVTETAGRSTVCNRRNANRNRREEPITADHLTGVR